MAIHYDKRSGRFKDDTGRFVAKARAMLSSVARREYEAATRAVPKKTTSKAPAAPGPKPAARKGGAKVPPKKSVRTVLAPAPAAVKAKPKPKPKPRPKPKAAPPAPAPKKTKPKPRVKPAPRPAPPPAPPRRRGGEPFYHPSEDEGIIDEFPDEWFPDPDSDESQDWDDIAEDWGDFADDDTTSAGPDGIGS